MAKQKYEPVPWAPPLTCWWNAFDKRGECNGKPVSRRCEHVHPQPKFCPKCGRIYPCQRPLEHAL